MSAPDRIHNHALPDELPVGEHLLWQGSPSWQSMAIHTFHARKVAIYFALLVLVRFAVQLSEGATLIDAATYAVWIVPMAIVGVALLVALAFMTARTTIYTITSKRVVMRIGIALSMTINIPFRIVESAGLKMFPDGSGDIALQLQPDSKAAYAVLWPHVRRWHFKHPQPSIRSVPDARHAADLLAEALAALPPVRVQAVAPQTAAMPGQLLAYPTAAE